jgi:peroxiredoxin
MLEVGTQAPDFRLPNQSRQDITLSGFRGVKNVVVAFHPLAFTPVCSAQAQAYERERPRFDALDAHVLVISSDPGPSKKAWGDSLRVAYDLLSDFHPQGQVARSYGVLGEGGLAERAVFVVNRSGIITWARRYEMSEQPNVEDALSALHEHRSSSSDVR